MSGGAMNCFLHHEYYSPRSRSVYLPSLRLASTHLCVANKWVIKSRDSSCIIKRLIRAPVMAACPGTHAGIRSICQRPQCDEGKASPNQRTSQKFIRQLEADKSEDPPMTMWFPLASNIYLWPRTTQHCSPTYIKCKQDFDPHPLLNHSWGAEGKGWGRLSKWSAAKREKYNYGEHGGHSR